MPIEFRIVKPENSEVIVKSNYDIKVLVISN